MAADEAIKHTLPKTQELVDFLKSGGLKQTVLSIYIDNAKNQVEITGKGLDLWEGGRAFQRYISDKKAKLQTDQEAAQ